MRTNQIKQICHAYRHGDPAGWRAASHLLVDLTRRERLDVQQVAELAIALAESGEKVHLPRRTSYCDVPSTGGPASLSTLLCPLLLAASGIKVPKISATGSVAGGIDTLSLVPGFKGELARDEFVRLVGDTGIAHTAQSSSFCPADRELLNVRRECGLMESPELAAASLLAKKAAVPGCRAVFDFRVGPSGNVGNTKESAQRTADLFHAVALVLDLHISTVLTDNYTFPSSALGRLESLDLLLLLLDGTQPQISVDSMHRATCVALAAEALQVVERPDDARARSGVEDLLNSRQAYEVFLRHLSAQGASEEGLHVALQTRSRQSIHELRSSGSGYWSPPSLVHAAQWIKATQKAHPPDLDGQIGMRLRVSPGTKVEKGQLVAEVRYPRLGPAVQPPDWLVGTVTEQLCDGNRGVLGSRARGEEWRWRRLSPTAV